MLCTAIIFLLLAPFVGWHKAYFCENAVFAKYLTSVRRK